MDDLHLSVELRNENTQEGNTWFSTAGVEPEFQLYCDRAVWIALGRPDNIVVTVAPVKRELIR